MGYSQGINFSVGIQDERGDEYCRVRRICAVIPYEGAADPIFAIISDQFHRLRRGCGLEVDRSIAPKAIATWILTLPGTGMSAADL